METQKEFSEDEWIPFILREPDTFTGSVVREPKVEFTYNREFNVMRRNVVDASQAIKHLFVETLSNALDSIQRAREAKLPVGFVKVDFETDGPGIISITNCSADIMPVRKNEKGVWQPESLLGRLLSSSNYKAKGKTWAGKNGMGGSLANIFSDSFVVEVWDHVRHLYYKQSWKDNMTLDGEPQILPWYNETNQVPNQCGMVKVSYKLQLWRFGYEEGSQHYEESLIDYYIRKVIEGSFTSKGLACTVRYKDFEKTFIIKDIESYSRMFFEDTLPERKIIYTHKSKHDIEAIIYDTPDVGYQVSFVNGQVTAMGGVHVDEVLKPLLAKVSSLIQEMDKEDPKLNINDLLLHTTAFISVRVPDPKFTSQTKERLSSPRPNAHWHEDILQELAQWDMFAAIRETVIAKKRRVLSKTDGKKTKFVNIAKAEDANKAGGPESHLCRLIICEGDSAKNYALESLDYREGGRDYIGIYPISGKIINVVNASMEQLIKNKQITELKMILGLVQDSDLMVDENYHKLRYGKVEIMTDADGDGSHIRGLLMLFLAMGFPGFLFRECLQTWLTPLVRATKSKTNVLSFYTMKEFSDWKNQQTEQELKKWKVKYYKGLGSSDTDEIKEDCAKSKLLTQTMEPDDREKLINAFDKTRVSFRKEQVYQRVHEGDMRDTSLAEMTKQTVEQFINTDLLDYTLLSINRAIPNLMDGLKVSERKALWYGLKYLKGEMKTSQVANDTANKMDYPHNEDILARTISNMTQEFPGSNNMAYFQGRGKFGAMYRHAPSAGRYTYVAPNWWLRMVFRTEDDEIMPMMSEEGKECEPEFLIPIIPMVLINGCLGIATSVSTFVPAYNPTDIVKELKRILTNSSPIRTLLVPYYRGFKGTVELLVDRKKAHRELLANQTEETPNKVSSRLRGPKKAVFDTRTYEDELPKHINAIQFCGCYQEKPGKIVRITELPIGFAGEDYKQLLDQWREQKRIKDYDNHSKVNSMDFTVYGVEDPTYQSLCLVRRMGTTNKNLITPVGGFPCATNTKLLKGESNERYIPEKYETVHDILDTYVECRLHYYKIRKNNIVNKLNMELYKLKNKARFIKLVLDGELKIQNVPIETIEMGMKKNNLPMELLDHTSVKSFTKEEVIRLNDKIEKLSAEAGCYNSKSVQEIWLDDLQEFETAYLKHYKQESAKFSVVEDTNTTVVNELELMIQNRESDS